MLLYNRFASQAVDTIMYMYKLVVIGTSFCAWNG